MSPDTSPELASLANTLGAAWPRTDEDMVYATALRWTETATALRARHTDLPELSGTAANADVLAAALLALAGMIAEYKQHALSILADLARFLTASPGPHADLLAATLARTALTRATRTAATVIDGPVSTVLATIATR
jgi:hypothetical protein